MICFNLRVALLAEGVGRNADFQLPPGLNKVALLAEGVGRNPFLLDKLLRSDKSPSSRRAWVEMVIFARPSVRVGSPSSRRAWVEIPLMKGEKHNENRRPPRGGRG